MNFFVEPIFTSLALWSLLFYAILYAVAKIKKRHLKHLRNISGPTPLFPFGNTHDFFPGSIVFLENIMRYFKEHGDTFIFHDGPLSCLLVTRDYELNEKLYSSTEHTHKSVQYELLGDGWLGDGLLTSNGVKWKKHRKIITPAFHFSILQDFLLVFDTVGNNLVRKLRQQVGNKSVEISESISLFALDVICETAMGASINALEGTSREGREYIESIKTVSTIVMERIFSFVHPLFYKLTWNYYKERSALKVIHRYVDSVIDKRIKERQDKASNVQDDETAAGARTRKPFLDLLLDTKIDGRDLTRTELRDEVNTFMFEGHDTTASALTFCILMLATHSEVQAKAFEEQEKLFKEWEDIKDVVPTSSQLSQMKYLELVVKETLRLYPSVPLIGRKLTKDLEYKGTILPKGTNISLITYAAHRKSEYFDNPEKFIPERFKMNNTEKFPFAYIPFSAGPRNCIGQKFAMMEILCTLSKIIRNFQLGPAVPDHKVQIVAESILKSKNGVKISIQAR